MKKIINGKIRPVLYIAICILFIATTFSSTARLHTETADPTPIPIRDNDWNYWLNQGCLPQGIASLLGRGR